MPNLSTSLIQFEIYDNDQLCHSGTCHYDLLPQVWTLTEDGTRQNSKRYLKFNIDGDWFTLNAVGTTEGNQNMAVETYEAIVEYQDLYLKLQQSKEAFKIAQDQEEHDRIIYESREFQRIAREALDQFNNMVDAQQQLTKEQAQLNEAEQLRQDENRIALVRGIALDPNMAPDALQSEFGYSGDIRRQVAAVMEQDLNITKRIVQLPLDCWTSSYEIMAVVGAQCSEDTDLAQLVADHLPDDSNLKTMLKSFGWAT